MKVPNWIHRGTNDGYHKSVAAVVVAAVDEDMVAGCVAAMTVLRDVYKTE